jgi:nicotinamidase/pyrazinamidase
LTAKPALIIVDLQRDFCPGGALPVREGDKVIEPINALVDLFHEKDLPVFYTRDWHPKDHVSFKQNGGTWPPHAIRGTPGAQFPSTLHVPRGAAIIDKATRRNAEAYSGFQGTDLAERLRRAGVEELYIVGLATDYCVKNTVTDGIAAGFRLNVVSDCVKGVNLKRTDSATAFRSMMRMGGGKTTSQLLLKHLSGRVAVWSSS